MGYHCWIFPTLLHKVQLARGELWQRGFRFSRFFGIPFLGKDLFSTQLNKKTSPIRRKLLRAKMGTWWFQQKKGATLAALGLRISVLECCKVGRGAVSKAGLGGPGKQLDYLFLGKSNLEQVFWGSVPWLPGSRYMFNHLGSLCTFTSQCFSWVEEHFEFSTAHISLKRSILMFDLPTSTWHHLASKIQRKQQPGFFGCPASWPCLPGVCPTEAIGFARAARGGRVSPAKINGVNPRLSEIHWVFSLEVFQSTWREMW